MSSIFGQISRCVGVRIDYQNMTLYFKNLHSVLVVVRCCMVRSVLPIKRISINDGLYHEMLNEPEQEEEIIDFMTQDSYLSLAV